MTYVSVARSDRADVPVLRDWTTAVLVAQQRAALIALEKVALGRLSRVRIRAAATVFSAVREAEVCYVKRAQLHKISGLQPPNAESNLREVRLNRATSELEGTRERWLD